MKLSPAFLALLLPLVVNASPVSNPEPVPAELESRDLHCTITGDGVRYRRCPRTSCDAIGQYAKGTKVTLTCYTDTNTTPVNGDEYVLHPLLLLVLFRIWLTFHSVWYKNSAGWYVSGYYIGDCSGRMSRKSFLYSCVFTNDWHYRLGPRMLDNSI
jgi:hypothetical protein